MLRSLLALTLALPLSAAADPGVELIINDPTKFTAPLDQCITDHCKAALDLIEGAEKTLDIAIYGMRNQSALYKAIVAARDRGVRVRIAVDKDLNDHNYYASTPLLEKELGDAVRDDHESDLRTKATKKPYDPSMARCEAPAGFKGPPQCLGYDLGKTCLIAVHASREPLDFQGDIMHHKFIVADQERVWMGSTNLSDSGTGGYNANLVVVLDHPQIGAWYTEEFEQLWVHDRWHNEKIAKGTRKRVEFHDDLAVELFFSPQDEPMSRTVRPLLQGAKKRIDVGVFFLTEKGVAADLIAAHQRGVKVRVLIDATAATNGYTKHEILRAAGIPVKVENWGGKMHMKSAVVDGEVVISGSMNFTSAGTRSNDENTAILYSRKLARQYDDAFQKMWDSVPDQWLKGRPDAESMDSPVACADGVDNDFDHKADAEDPGCQPDAPPLKPLPPYQLVPKEDGHNLIKGIVTESGQRLFYTTRSPTYGDITVDEASGGRWFCAEGQAWDEGFRRARD